MPRKTDILDAALALHAEEGLESLTMRRLAETLGMSPMGLYRHYANREALLAAMVDRGFDRLRTVLVRPLRARDPLGRLVERWDRTLAFSLAHPRLFDLMFLTPGMVVRAFPHGFEQEASPTFPVFVGDIRDCMDAGVLRPDDPSQVAFLLWTQVHGLLAFRFRGRLSDSPAQLKRRFRDHLERLLHGLAGGSR